MALKLLVDTSVWLDLAKDYRRQPVIAALEDLVAAGEIELLVPQVLLDEFTRNKERVATDAIQSLQSHFNLVRDAVSRFAEETEKAATLKSLNEVDHAAIMRGEAVNDSISRIEKLLASTPETRTLFLLLMNSALTFEVLEITRGDREPERLPYLKIDQDIVRQMSGIASVPSGKTGYSGFELDDLLLGHFESLGWYVKKN